MTSLPAQTAPRRAVRRPPASGLMLLSITATGSKRYTSADIAAATNLEIGYAASDADFQRVSAELGGSGAFSSVSYSYEYSGEGAKLELKVSDNDKFAPAYFDNVVWFTEQELMAGLRSRVPLFLGQLPIDGKMADQVSAELQAMLVERGVQGKVDYLRAGPENGSTDSFVYSVSGPSTRIHDVHFSGAGAEELPLLQAASDRLQGQDYQRSTLKDQAEKVFLPIYLARGYLKASFGDFQPKVVQQNDDSVDVDVTFTVKAGEQYKATEIQLAGAKLIPAEKLREVIHLPLGQPANEVRLSGDIEAIKKLYGVHGYMAATVQLTPTLDDAAGTVKYQLQVHEGEIYHMGDLDIEDLDHHDTERVAERWAIAKGDAYDSSYPKRFVAEILHDILSRGEWNVNIREMPDPADKSVDVSVKFERKATL